MPISRSAGCDHTSFTGPVKSDRPIRARPLPPPAVASCAGGNGTDFSSPMKIMRMEYAAINRASASVAASQLNINSRAGSREPASAAPAGTPVCLIEKMNERNSAGEA